MPKQKCEVCEGEFKNLTLHKKRKHGAETSKEESIDLEKEPTNVDLLEEFKSTIDNLERANTAIYRRLEEIKARLLKLEIVKLEIVKEEIKEEIPKISVETPKVESTTTSSSFPIPAEYREVIITILNSNFGIKIDYFPDRPEFMFTIIVPTEYGHISESESKAIGGDLRSRIISNADGINGVRKWAETVYKSFNPEMQAKIKLTP